MSIFVIVSRSNGCGDGAGAVHRGAGRSLGSGSGTVLFFEFAPHVIVFFLDLEKQGVFSLQFSNILVCRLHSRRLAAVALALRVILRVFAIAVDSSFGAVVAVAVFLDAF